MSNSKTLFQIKIYFSKKAEMKGGILKSSRNYPCPGSHTLRSLLMSTELTITFSFIRLTVGVKGTDIEYIHINSIYKCVTFLCFLWSVPY